MTIAGLAMLVLAAPVEIVPMDSPQSLTWGKKDTGYLLGDAKTLVLEVGGPTGVLLELRGDHQLKAKKITVEILRNETFLSKNNVAFKPTPGGPEKLRFAAKLGFKVPEGKHRFVVRVDTAGLAMRATEAKNVPKALLSAAEQSVSTPEATAGSVPPSTPLGQALSSDEEHAAVATMTHEANQQLMGGNENKSGLVDGDTAKSESAALRVAVYDLELQGIDARVGAVVTDSLLAEVRKLQGVSAIGMAEIRDMLSLEADKQMVGCADSESCLAEIAGALGVDDLVTGTLSKVGDGNVLVVRRLDQRQGKIRGTVNQRLKAGAGDEFLLAIGPAVSELFPERELKPGKARGVAKEVALRINPPPLPKWSFYAVAGGAVVAAIAGGVLEYLAQDKASQYRDYAASGVNSPSGISGKTLVGYGDEATSRADAARYIFVGSGVSALAAGVIAFFTDWHGYGETQSPAR